MLGQTLAEALEPIAILSEVAPKMAFVNQGYRGVEGDGAQVWRWARNLGVTDRLQAMS